MSVSGLSGCGSKSHLAPPSCVSRGALLWFGWGLDQTGAAVVRVGPDSRDYLLVGEPQAILREFGVHSGGTRAGVRRLIVSRLPVARHELAVLLDLAEDGSPQTPHGDGVCGYFQLVSG